MTATADGTRKRAGEDRLCISADEAVAACGGDLRATIEALIVLVDHLEKELSLARSSVSRGYARGRYAKP
jgi:hypothetical protein